MTDLWNIRLVGTLESLSPICIVPPGADEIVLPDKSSYKLIAHRLIYENGIRFRKPVVPGSTLRGRLRRAAVEVVLGLTGEKIPLREWHQNAVGGIKGAEQENAYDVVRRQQLREKNPILGLFGAGDPWMMGRASIWDAVPVETVETNIAGGVRVDDGSRDQAFFEKLDADASSEWLALKRGNKLRTNLRQEQRKLESELRSARKEKNEPEVARLTTALAELRDADEAKEATATNAVGLTLAHEALPSGVTFTHRITLAGITDEEAGLFFAAFNHFLKCKPHLGQHQSLGYGLLGGAYDVFLAAGNATDPFAISVDGERPLGTMRAEPVAGLSNVPPRIAAFMERFREAHKAGAFDFRLAADVFAEAAS
jgi:CRISPR type IV-associated protein Csf2